MINISNLSNNLEKNKQKSLENNLNLFYTLQIYDLVIPEDVENKIKFLCKKINNIEWSGILFYTKEGNFEDNSIKFKCLDIFPMDIGDATTTSFEMTSDVVSYMTGNTNLLQPNVYQGLIHSHHSMATFFSSTDTNTLQVEGSENNHFLSLIVNNAGTYTAKITKKNKDIISGTKIIKYGTFNNEKYTSKEIPFTEIKECIEVYSLNIIKKEIPTFEILNDRLEEITKNKKQIVQQPYNNTPNFELFETDKFNIFNTSEKKFKNEPKVKSTIFKEQYLKDLIYQLLTGNILVINSSLNLQTWVANMEKHFDNRFGNTPKGFKIFQDWASNFMEFICWNIPLPEKELDDLGGDNYVINLLALKLINLLSTFTPNKYIKEYISILNYYTYD